MCVFILDSLVAEAELARHVFDDLIECGLVFWTDIATVTRILETNDRLEK